MTDDPSLVPSLPGTEVGRCQHVALSVSKLGQSGEDWDKWVTVVPPEAEPEIRIPGNALRQVRKRNSDKNDTNKGNVTKQVVTMGVDLRAPGELWEEE